MLPATTGRNKPGAGEFEASNAKWRMSRRVEPRAAARPVRPTGALCGERCRGRRAGAAGRASSRARGGAASLRGMRMALNLPVSAYRGVAIRLLRGASGDAADRRGRARTSGSRPGAAAVRLGRGRRVVRRMAQLGRRARLAAAGCRQTTGPARAVRAHRAACASTAPAAPPPPQRHQDAGARRSCCGARPAGSPPPRRFIAASARLSRGIDPELFTCSAEA